MINQTIKVENGIITLPKKLQEQWKKAEVFVLPGKDTLIIKKIYQPKGIFGKDAEKKLQALGKKITKKDIGEAVIWARSKGG